MKSRKKLNKVRERRASRVAARIMGTAERPRLVVSRSNQYVYAQLIDDVKGLTLAAVSSFGKGNAPGAAGKRETKTVQAFNAGVALAEKALEKGIKTAVFDRGSSRFHGRVKSFADGAKKGGLTI